MEKKKLQITSRGRYAVMAMVELAKSSEQTPVPLSDIAENGNLSLSYLEQLVAGLRRHNLVRSHRGPGGGYVIARPLSEILISEILIAAEDSTPAKRNANNSSLKLENCQYTMMLWGVIGELLHTTLNRLSLHDVIFGSVREHPTISKIFEISR